MYQKTIFLVCSFAALFTISSCGLFSEPIPEFDINSVIAQTANAAQTQTAVSLPTATSTITPTISPTAPTPTATDFFDILKVTPSIPYETLDPELGLEVEVPGFSVLQQRPANVKYSDEDWSCLGDGRYPPKGAVVTAGESFVATWTVINNGQRDWTQNIIDFVYKSGYRHEGTRIQDLDRYVASGNRVTFQVKYIAPKKAGIYYSAWELRVGSYPFCGIQFEFEVQNKKK